MMAIVLRFNHFIVVSSKCKNDYESLTWVLEETITSQQQELFAFLQFVKLLIAFETWGKEKIFRVET